MRAKKGFWVIMMVFFGAVALHAALPFLLWLQAPTRSNPNDPKSPLFFPTNTPGSATAPSYDGKDPGDNVATGATALGSIAAGNSANDGLHYIDSGSDSADWYSVDYVLGQTYDINATRSSGSSALTVQLYWGPASAPSLVTANSGSPAIISGYTANVTETYFIKVTSASTDRYTLTVSNTTGAPPTNTPLPTLTPTQANTLTATLTATPTPPGAHGSLVTDFESGLQTIWVGTAGSIFPSVDGYGSTFNPSPYATTAGGSTLPGGSAGNAGCFSGTEAIQVGPPTNQYPYCVLLLELNAGGEAPASASTNLLTYAPAKSMTFSYKASVITGYIVDIVTKNVLDNGYYQYVLTPPDTTSWHTQTIYFPDGAGAPKFAQPAWAAAVPWSTEEVAAGAVRFQPVPSTASTVPYGICVDDVTFAAPPTPTPTDTPTPTPVYSPTMTQTPIVGAFNGLWYDGDSAGAQLADVSFMSDSATATDQAAGGNPGHDALFSYTAALYYASADIDRNGATGEDVSLFNQLEFDVKVPGAGHCFSGMVELLTSQASPNDTSMPVTMTTYASPQGPVSSGSWVHIKMPLAAFNGANGNGGTFSAGFLSGIVGVRFLPMGNAYDGTGAFTGSFQVDNVKFSIGAPAPSVAIEPAVFADFETGKSDSTNWGGYWSSSNDQDAPDFTCSPGTPSSRVFPSSNTVPPIMADGNGDSITPCHYGEYSGYKGGDGNGGGAGECGAGNYSYFSMAAPFNPASAGPTLLDMDIPAVIGFTPSAIRFNVKAGPHDTGGQQYFIAIVTELESVIGGGCSWQAYFNVTSSWTTVTIPFPANGTVGPWASWGTWPPVDNQFHQPPNAPAGGVWGTDPTYHYDFHHFKQFQMAAFTTEHVADMEIDDIQFLP